MWLACAVKATARPELELLARDLVEESPIRFLLREASSTSLVES
jgi:hypothetical protein